MKVNFFPKIYNSDLSFSSRKDVMKRSDRFSDEIVTLAKKKGVSSEEIHNLIRSYVPDIQISTNRIKRSRGANLVGEYMGNYIFTRETRRFDLGDKMLALSPISGRSFTKLDLVECIAHEMTHAFQSEDKDYSIKNLFNKYLSGLTNEQIEINVSKGFDFWFYFEDTIFNDFMNFCYKASSVNRNKFPFTVNVAPDVMKKTIEEKFAHAKNICPEFDEKFLRAFIKYQLKAEADAYEAGGIARNKCKRSNCGSTNMILSDLYRQVAACI